MNGPNFMTVTPIEVKPTPMSSVRRALSDDKNFVLFPHYENDHFALAILSAPFERETFPAKLFASSSHSFPVYSSTPRQANLLSWAPNLRDDFACTLCVCVCVAVYFRSSVSLHYHSPVISSVPDASAIYHVISWIAIRSYFLMLLTIFSIPLSC